METLGFVLAGLFVICFGVGTCGATIFRIKHREDWEERWFEARPLTGYFLWWLRFGALIFGRAATWIVTRGSAN